MRSRWDGNGKPYARCSASNHPVPIPRSMRPPETWSAVTTSLASTEGWRKVAGETSVPEPDARGGGGQRADRAPRVERRAIAAGRLGEVVIGAVQPVRSRGARLRSRGRATAPRSPPPGPRSSGRSPCDQRPWSGRTVPRRGLHTGTTTHIVPYRNQNRRQSAGSHPSRRSGCIVPLVQRCCSSHYGTFLEE